VNNAPLDAESKDDVTSIDPVDVPNKAGNEIRTGQTGARRKGLEKSTGKQWAAIGAVILVCLAIGVGVVLSAQARLNTSLADREAAALEEIGQLAAVTDDGAEAETTPTAPLAPALVDVGDLVFINRVPGDDYGKLATIGDDGEREFFGPVCERAHASAGMAVCLEPDSAALVPTWTARILDFTNGSLPEIFSENAPRPSRARVDPRGARVAFTGFVTGHDYLAVGEFASETTYVDFSRNGQVYKAAAIRESEVEERFRAVDGNWWGVTFDPTSKDHVYLTYGSGGQTEIVRSDQLRLRFNSAIDDASCPSVSPDGELMVFKRAIEGEDAPMSLVVRGLNTGEERVLNEERFVDDQVEWLDNETILYGLAREDSADGPQVSYDIWSLDITDPEAEPELHVAFADSPGIYRDSR